MGKLTTHVLNTAHGCPGAGMKIELYRIHRQTSNEVRQLIGNVCTNHDGRCDTPLLEQDQFLAGEYELVFHAGDYFATQAVQLPSPPFLDRIALRFGVADPSAHYHVPLLVSPWSYSTYRGS